MTKTVTGNFNSPKNHKKNSVVQHSSLLYSIYMGFILCFVPLIVFFVILTFTSKIKIIHLIISCLLGLLTVLPVSLIQYFIPGFTFQSQIPVLTSILQSLIIYGLIEEVFKTVFMIPVPYKEYSRFQMILLSFLFGISLACFESAVYFFTYLHLAADKGASLLYSKIFIRIFTADILHTACAGLNGIFLYRIRQKNRKISILIFSIVLHGLYDFFAGLQGNLQWFAIPVILLAVLECRIKYTALENSQQ